MRKTIVAAGLALTLMGPQAFADCVVGASLSTRYKTIDSSTILLMGIAGPKVLAKIDCCLYPGARVTVLKDMFCDYEDAVFLIDGRPVDVHSVKNLY